MVSETRWRVQEAVPDHAAQLAAMHAESFRVAYLGDDESRNHRVLAEAKDFLTPARIENRTRLIQQASERDNELYQEAINADGEPIGLAYGSVEDRTQELMALYVHPDYFGTGVGRELTQSFIDWCDPGQNIELGVAKNNVRAQRFYTKMGFYGLGDNRRSYYPFIPETTMIRFAGLPHDE